MKIKMSSDSAEGGVFASHEAIFLKRAFVLAQQDLGPKYILDDAARSKLAKIVATVARKRLLSGCEIGSEADAASVAEISSSRFIVLKAE